MFCTGDGYSSRAADSVLNGCIPVIIMDEVDAVFETILDWNLFSVRIAEVYPAVFWHLLKVTANSGFPVLRKGRDC